LASHFLLVLLALIPVEAGSTPYSTARQLNINVATLAQVESLPVEQSVAREMFRYVATCGALKSIYELRRIPALTPGDFERIKLLIRIQLPEFRREGARYVHSVQRELAAEESPSEAAIEEWQELVLSPMNINKASVDDLLLLPNVTLLDAASVARHLRIRPEIKDARELRGSVEGLTDYGYRNMRNYVMFKEPAPVKFDGNYRFNYEYDEDLATQDKLATLDQNIATLGERATFRRAGFSDEQIDYFERRLTTERDYLSGLQSRNALRNRLRARLGSNLRFGFWADKDFNRHGSVSDFKGFAGLYDFSIFKKVLVGDFRATVGQGLMIDNSNELSSRFYDRTQGIFNDLTSQDLFAFRGAAADMVVPWLRATAFYSRSARNGILNPDGTVNYYAYTDPVLPANQRNFNELNAGGTARLDLGRSNWFSPGTYVALNGLHCGYDRDFAPDARWLDLPGDGVLLNDANYTQLARGNTRRFWGADFRTSVSNLSLEGEYARQVNAGSACLFSARAQYNYLYLVGLFRHYDVNYDNPYNRGFTEMKRFEDTPIEKSYRIIDPTLVDMMYFPMPKAEEGIYLETRYQVSRQITFTRAYVDVWRNLATGLMNYRFQGEVEYRPVFPLRLRLKEKIQKKQLAKDVSPTTSLTYETSLRALASLPGWDFLTAELRAGRVELTPSLAYNSNTAIWGGFLSIGWQHNFSDDFNTEVGIAAWQTSGMSQWIFDDVGIDFLDGRGMKYYITASDRLSDFLLLKVKFRQKLSEYAHTGLAGSGYQPHYLEPGGTVPDFNSLRNSYYVGVQLDLLW
jgi:DNA uptake protein ComE-like DNA-binding protein